MKLLQICSVTELLAESSRYNALWLECSETLPTLTAELLAHHVTCLASKQRFVVLAIEDHGKMIAAIPIVGETRAKILQLGTLPNCGWGAFGELMVHPDYVARDDVYEQLLDGIAKLGWPLLSLRGIDPRNAVWQKFAEAMQRRDLSINVSLICAIGKIDLQGDWPRYQAAWSRQHRSSMKRSLKKAGDSLALERRRILSPDVLRQSLQAFAEVEHRSWKGDAGTSLVASNMTRYFQDQAALLNQKAGVEFIFLHQGEQVIAAEIAYVAKGVFHAFKTAYDPAFKQLAPGQLLHRLLWEELFREGEFHTVDTMGPLTEATARWCTHKQLVYDLTLATRRRYNSLLKAYRVYWPQLRDAWGNQRSSESTSPRCGAARFLETGNLDESQLDSSVSSREASADAPIFATR